MSQANAALYGTDLRGNPVTLDTNSKLHDLFVMPPFSTWNTREGKWQSRKRRWLALGIQSELGRVGKLAYKIPDKAGYEKNAGMAAQGGTSAFDPVVCELAYHWWCPKGGRILDPFAGGSVRGIVASVMGYQYRGIELRAEQVAANRAQLTDATTGPYKPMWKSGDSGAVLPTMTGMFDMVKSCPPYGDLEKYSDDPADISNRSTYEAFLHDYYRIIALSAARLKDNRFAVWTVANYRCKKTKRMIDFVGDTVRAFQEAGMHYYNDCILINCVGTGGMRTNTSFVRGRRKLIKLHQNVLVFVKGDWKEASDYITRSEG